MDLEYAANELKMPHFNSVDQPCLHCRASRNPAMGELNIRHVGAGAPWRLTCRSVADNPVVSDHPVWSVPGVTAFMYPGDLMHSAHLGPVSSMHASVIQLMCNAPGPYQTGSFSDRVHVVWNDIQQSTFAWNPPSNWHTPLPIWWVVGMQSSLR